MAGINWDEFEDAKPAQKQNSINWDEFETVQTKPQITQGESLARGAAQGASLGFADEISGGVEALWEKAKGNPTEFGKLYEIARNESRENFKKAQEANPGTYMAGEIGGGVATAFVPGVAAAKGAKLANVAARAAGFGGAAGAGYSEADNVGGVLKDAATGAVLGGALAGAAPLVGKVAARAGVGAKNSAERLAARAVGAERGTLKKLSQKEIQELGRQAIDEKIITPLASTDDMIARNEAIKTGSMNTRRAAYEKIDKAAKSTFNPLEVATELETKVLDGKNIKHLDTQELIKKLNPEIDNILSRGDGNITMKEAQELVQNLGKRAKFDTSRSTEANELAKTVYHTVRDAINKAAEKGGDAINLGDVVKTSNKRFATAKNTEKLLANKSAREQGNKLMGITDYSIVGAGLPSAVATGGASAAATAGAVGVKKTFERFGSQNAALAMDKTSKALMQSPKAAASVSRSPVVLDQIGTRPVQNEFFRNVAESKPKGEDKWANDGGKKLIDSGLSPEIIEQLKQDKKGKRLLIEASDLTPGSKAMDSVIKRIRTGSLNKGEQ